MLTNLGTTEDQEKAKSLGATDYIVKASLTPAQVSDAIKKYL
jgi:PleD family two-component response regulator